VLDVAFAGSGSAFLFRDGKAIRPSGSAAVCSAIPDSVDGLPLRSNGQHLVRGHGTSTTIDQKDSAWRFGFMIHEIKNQ